MAFRMKYAFFLTDCEASFKNCAASASCSMAIHG
jgi:hypothetical protein